MLSRWDIGQVVFVTTINNVLCTWTLLFLQLPDILQLFDYRGEGVGDDCDHDEEGEQEDEHCRQDVLDVLEWQVDDTPSRYYFKNVLFWKQADKRIFKIVIFLQAV